MNSKQKNILIGGLLAIVLILGVAYAAFQSQLNITGTTSIDSKWDVRITSITPDKKATNSGTEASPNYTTAGDISHSITNNDLTANFAAGLVSPGDTVVYTIKVKNNGTLNAVLNTLTKTPSTNPAITFEVSGIEQNDILNAGGEKEFTVTVAYANVESQPTSTSASFSLTLDFVQTNGSSSGGGGSSELTPVYAFHPYHDVFLGTTSVLPTEYECDYNEEEEEGECESEDEPDNITYYPDPSDLISDGYAVFMKYEYDSSNIIQNGYVCTTFGIFAEPICLQGGSKDYYEANQLILDSVSKNETFKTSGETHVCGTNDIHSYCYSDRVDVSVYATTGEIDITDHDKNGTSCKFSSTYGGFGNCFTS